MSLLLRFALLLAFLSLAFHAALANNASSVPSTPRNKAFFALAQKLLDEGNLRLSSCGAERQVVQQCIQKCNSPGPAERDGCCCITLARQFFVGVRGGCRYVQKIENFTTNLIYSSIPVTGALKYFDKLSCAFTTEPVRSEDCVCRLEWEATAIKLDVMSPIPSPSPFGTPVLSAVPSLTAVPPRRSASATPEVVTPVVTSDASAPPRADKGSAQIPVPVTPDAGRPSNSAKSPVNVITPTASTSPISESATASVSPAASTNATSLEDELESEAPSSSPDPENDDGSVCVDQKYLLDQNHPSAHFVHSNGFMSPVLCPRDSELPCGTANHKIRINREAISYRQLCARPHVQCDRDNMLVNSVYTHVWREVEHGDAVLTMYDVRYHEAAQRSLHTVMHRLRNFRERFASQS